MNITIDGRKAAARSGETILEVARREGVFIPTLCNDEKLDPYASCWICAVKVAGAKRLKPACSTRVSEGMEVVTDDEELRAARRLCLELLLSDHCGDCVPPCRVACPANCDARGYVKLVAEGRYDDARRLVMETIPLPGTIGRICPHPCEEECRRAVLEGPLAICALKRVAADRASSVAPPPPKAPTGKRVAVVGSGPSGLSAAYFLALEGHAVTVFESREKPGGMLRYGIPEYRLPNDYLDREIAVIGSLGVTIECGVRIGDDVTVPGLRERGFHAVLIAAGAQLNRRMGIGGEDLPGVYGGIDFLAAVAGGERPFVGRRTIVVGGGDTATDAARTALRLGAEEVSLVYRRSREEMPAAGHEIGAAEEEGVALRLLTLPLAIGRGNEGLEVTCSRMALGEPDESGRRRPIPIAGSDFTLPCDSVIMAIGQGVDLSVIKDSKVSPTKKNRISAREGTCETSIEGVFAAGDCVTGPGIAIEAVAGGRRAAHAINAYLVNGAAAPMPPLSAPARISNAEVEPAEFADVERRERAVVPEEPPRSRRRNFGEVEEMLLEEAAVAEASRCLDCGCTESSICTIRDLAGRCEVGIDRFGSPRKTHEIDDRHPHIVRDPDKCIRCARCIRVCDEVQGIAAWCYVGRGFGTEVAPPFGAPLQDTECESCGQCVTSCPTGALTEKPVLPKSLMARAVPTETTCSRCGLGCPIVVHTAGFRIGRITPHDGANLCEKGRFRFAFLTDKKRIVFPMARRGGRLRRVDWNEAREVFRREMRGIPGRRIAVFVSVTCTNEEAFGAQKFARAFLGSPHIHPLGGRGPARAIFSRSGLPVSKGIEEIGGSDLIAVIDPSLVRFNEVAALPVIAEVRRGAGLVIVGRAKTKLDRLASRKMRVSPNRPEEYLGELRRLLSGARRPFILFNRDLLDDAALLALGRLAAEARCPVVSLSSGINARGVVEAGISPFLLPGGVSLKDGGERTKREGEWGGRIPAQPGPDYEECLRAMAGGKIEAAIFLGPCEEIDRRVREALGGTRVVIAQALSRSPLTRLATLALPAASAVETSGTFTRYDGKILRCEKALPPLCGYSNIEIWEMLMGGIHL